MCSLELACTLQPEKPSLFTAHSDVGRVVWDSLVDCFAVVAQNVFVPSGVALPVYIVANFVIINKENYKINAEKKIFLYLGEHASKKGDCTVCEHERTWRPTS